MNVVDQNKVGAGGQRARFRPLEIVARALSGRASEPAPMRPGEPAFAPMREAPTETVATPEAGETFLAIVNAMLGGDNETALAPDETVFELISLIDEAHDVFGLTAARQGVTLTLEIAPGAGGVYRGDLARARQAVLNLLSGALKATTTDALGLAADWDDGLLTLRLDGAEAGAAMARVLADETQPGTRRPAAHRLALAKTSVLALGGMTCATAEGVEMTVPLQRMADRRATPRQPERAPSAPPSPVFAPGLRVLVAEEDVAHQQMLRTLLGDMGLDAVVVGDGQELVAAWRHGNWDALLIDIEGEAICGRSLVRSIRAAEATARWPRTPMLALAAQVKPRDLAEDFAELIDGLVVKPLHATGLHAAIEAALDAEPAAAPSLMRGAAGAF